MKQEPQPARAGIPVVHGGEDVNDIKPGTILAGRIRDAREYLGFTIADVSGALGWDEDNLMNIEDGLSEPTVLEMERLGRLYQRAPAWFTGESRFEPDTALLRQVEGLSEHDRDEVLAFAEFLQGAGPPARPQRDRKASDG